MTHTYIPKGVCCKKIEIDLDGNRIAAVQFSGGCSGNLQGISALLVGQSCEEAIRRLAGIQCGQKGTSCPDQLSLALRQICEGNEKEVKKNG